MTSNVIINNCGEPLYGNVSLSPDTYTSALAILIALLSTEQVTITNVLYSELIREAIDLVSFTGALVEYDESTVQISPDRIITHAIPTSLAIDITFKWLAAMTILARTGKSGIEYMGLSENELATLKLFVSRLGENNIEVEDDGEFLIFTYSPNWLSDDIKILNLQSYEPIEVISYLCLISSDRVKNVALQHVPWSYCSNEVKSIMHCVGFKVVTEEYVVKLEKLDHPELSYNVPPSVLEGLFLSVITALNGGDIKISGITKSAWTSILSTFNKIGLEYKIENTTLRVWSESHDAYEVTNLTSDVYPALSREMVTPFIILLSRTHEEFEVSQKAWTKGIDYINDLHELGIESTAIEKEKNGVLEDEEYIKRMKVFGETSRSANSIPLDTFSHAEIPVLWALTQHGAMELQRYDVFTKYYPGFTNSVTALGMVFKEV